MFSSSYFRYNVTNCCCLTTSWGFKPLFNNSILLLLCRITHMVYSHWLSPGPGPGTTTRTWTNGLYGFMYNLSHCTWTGPGKNGLCTHFPCPETVLGGAFYWYFNGFQVSSPGVTHSQCEWFLHDIGPSPGPQPGPGHSQCDYTIKVYWHSLH